MQYAHRRDSLAIQPRRKSSPIVLILILIVVSAGYIIFLLTKTNELNATYDQLDRRIVQNRKTMTQNIVLMRNKPAITLLKDNPFRPSTRWLYVSYLHALPNNYKPHTLVAIGLPEGGTTHMKVADVIQPSLIAMFRAAKKDGVGLVISSAYRTDSQQTAIFDRYVQSQGVEVAKKYVADLGESEHATGLAVDINTYSELCDNDISLCAISNETGAWLEKHAPNYGFILRYPKSKESITGIANEPWHFRYVGTGARSLTDSGLTLDELVQKVEPSLLKG